MLTERCGGAELRACSHVLIECEPLLTVDEWQGLRGGEESYYFIHYPSPRALTRAHKRRPINAGMSFRLFLLMCAKKG